MLGVVTGLLLVASVVCTPARSARRLDQLGRFWLVLAGFALVATWPLVQMAPAPFAGLQHPLWLEAIWALGPGIQGRISVDPEATATALMRLLTYGGVFVLAVQLGRSRASARRLILAVVLAGVAYALYGLLVETLDLGTVLWWNRWSGLPGVTSSFVNRNSYATYAGLGLLCATALLIPRAQRELANGARLGLPWRLRLRRLSGRAGWLLAAALALLFALLLTRSRAGVASTAVGLAALLAAFGASRLMGKREVMLSAAVLVGVGAMAFALAGDELAERLQADPMENTRFTIYQRVARAIGDTPVLGTGYGTFAQVFPPYQGRWSTFYLDQAHNTYLENALELGVPVALALVACIGAIAGSCALQLRERRQSAAYPCLGLAATALVGAHALLDFSLEIPAIAVTYAAILGVAFVRAHRRTHRSRGRRRHHARPGRRRTVWTAVLALGIGLLVLGTTRLVAIAVGVPALVVDNELEAGRMPPAALLDRAVERGTAAAAWGNSATNWARVGRAELALAQRPGILDAARRNHFQRAEGALRRSLALAPCNPRAWAQLAFVSLVLGGDPSRISGALALSVMTGPNQGPILPYRSALALAAWDRLDARTRAMFADQFAQAMRLAPQFFVRATVQRGREAVVRAGLEPYPDLRARFDRLALIFGRS